MSTDQHADTLLHVCDRLYAQDSLEREYVAAGKEAVEWFRARVAELEADRDALIQDADEAQAVMATEAEAVRLREALAAIRTRQPETLEMYRRHGIVFDYAPLSDPKAAEGETDWQNVAFRTYAVLCEIESMCAAALAGAEGTGE